MESDENDILSMFDKLKSSHLNAEGMTLLKSMAVSIKDALQKGLLLEQLLVDEKNKLIKFQTEKKRKKKKKRKNTDEKELDKNLTEDNQENTGKDLLSSMGSNDVSEEIKTPSTNLNSHLVALNDMPTPILESKVRLVDQSLLLNSSFSTSQPSERIVSPHSCQCNLSRMSSSPLNGPVIRQSSSPLNGTLTLQNNCPQLVVDQTSLVQPYPEELNQPLDNRVEMFNLFANSLFPNSNNSLAESGLLIPKQEPVDKVANESLQKETESKPTYSSVLKQSMGNAPLNEEEAFMPSPIMIKSEFLKAKTPEPSYDISINIAKPVVDDKINEKMNSQENEASNQNFDNSNVQNDFEKEKCMVYYQTGKDATEKEIREVFKNLEITYFKVIHKPLYTFGFIGFVSEDDKKVAISYSNKHFIQGKTLFIRHCGESRNPKSIKRSIETQDNIPLKKPRYSNDSKKFSENNDFPRNPKYTSQRRKTTGAVSDNEDLIRGKNTRSNKRSLSTERDLRNNRDDSMNESLENRINKEPQSSKYFDRSKSFDRTRPYPRTPNRDHFNRNNRIPGRSGNIRSRGNGSFRNRR